MANTNGITGTASSFLRRAFLDSTSNGEVLGDRETDSTTHSDVGNYNQFTTQVVEYLNKHELEIKNELEKLQDHKSTVDTRLTTAETNLANVKDTIDKVDSQQFKAIIISVLMFLISCGGFVYYVLGKFDSLSENDTKITTEFNKYNSDLANLITENKIKIDNIEKEQGEFKDIKKTVSNNTYELKGLNKEVNKIDSKLEKIGK
ncbi:hypothetical protein K6U58_11110 [Vibrio fluvialis]|uniref:hypothetical protein n=1 Tax=Vibrio fluvialis TaxID=676 RepID=UPI001C9D5A9D|nr:hypothetical protein [Vibrio fluvialis]MBY8216743.1 hypothetical protein [Vibrio fluvialis]MCG6359127.1 hypothetical protein [Vibrio fluvialis]